MIDTYEDGETVAVDLLAEWVEESYRAIVPKALLRRLGGEAPSPSEEVP
jgi:hypothetical protein